MSVAEQTTQTQWYYSSWDTTKTSWTSSVPSIQNLFSFPKIIFINQQHRKLCVIATLRDSNHVIEQKDVDFRGNELIQRTFIFFFQKSWNSTPSDNGWEIWTVVFSLSYSITIIAVSGDIPYKTHVISHHPCVSLRSDQLPVSLSVT